MRHKFSISFCLFLLCFAPSLALAQESPPASKTKPLRPTKDSAPDANSKEPYVIELLQNTIVFENDGKGYRDLALRVAIKSESAVREFGLMVYPFAYSFESLDVVYARVRKPSGAVVETPASDIQELDSAVSRQAPMYTDQREKHIAIKSLSVGDVLELNLRWTIHDPVAPGHFWYDHSYYRAGVCLKEILEINVPRDFPIGFRNVEPQPSIREEGDRRIHTFQNSNLKEQEESKIPAWERNAHGAPPPDVEISSFRSWQQVGEWFDALVQPKVTVTPEIRSRAQEIVKGKDTDEAKIQAIYDFVSTRFRYIGIDLGLSRYTPHSAAEVLTNRYGDCKDKHALFAALLQAVNIPAYPALISSNYRIDPSFPTPSLFDHVITFLPRGKSLLFLDTTPEVAPMGLLLPAFRDRQVLAVLPSGGAHLITTPADPPIPNYELFQIDSSIDSKGTLDGTMKLEERGDGEVALRLAYRATPQNKWEELTQKIVAGLGFAGTVSNVSVGPPEDTSQPFRFSFDYHRTDYPDWKNHRISLPSPPIVLPDLTEQQKLSKDPLPLGSPEDVTYDVKVELPRSFTLILPPKVERKYDFGEFSATYSFKENTLHGTYHLKTMLNEIPGADRPKFTNLAKTIDDTMRSYVFVTGNFSDGGVIGGFIPPGVGFPFENATDAIPRLEAALGADPDNDVILLRLSGLYCQSGRAPDAVALLQKAIAAHQDVPQHLHLALGKAYLCIPEVDKAMPEFKLGLGDGAEPDDLNEIAYALAEANAHLSEAQDYSTRAVSALSEKSVDISPEYADPSDFRLMLQLAANWDTFGWIKFRTGDFSGGEKYLQAAWEIWQSATIGEHLVEAYEKLGQKEKAASICNMALATFLSGRDSATKKKLSDEMTRLRPFLAKQSPRAGLVGSSRPVDGSLALSEMRALQVPFHAKLKGNSATANFLISITNGPKVDNVVFLSGSEELRNAATALAALRYPQTLPDSTPVRVIRKANLNCSIYTKDCTLVLTLAADAAVSPPSGIPTSAYPN